MSQKGWRIYRLTFPDGAVYVGQTRQTVTARLAGHRRKNTPVGRRLKNGETPKVKVVRVVPDQTTADTVETAYIERVPEGRRLNQAPPPAANTLPVDKTDQCSWCGRVKPVAEFTPDSSRTRGYDSKCRVCYRVYTRTGQFLRYRRTRQRSRYRLAYRFSREQRAAGKTEDELRWNRLEQLDWEAIGERLL